MRQRHELYREEKQLNAVNISQDELMIDLFGAELYENEPEKYEKYCSRIESYVKRKASDAQPQSQ